MIQIAFWSILITAKWLHSIHFLWTIQSGPWSNMFM